MASHNIVVVGDSNFDDEVSKSDVPVLVDFWAPWCAPCNMLAPIVEELAEEYKGKVKICKLNVDENPSVPGRFGIRGIPTLILFKDGKIVEQIVGLVPKATIKEILDKVV